MIALLALAAAAAEPATTQEPPFFPPNPRDHQIIERIYYHRVPDPGADNLRLCVKDGQLCGFYRQQKGVGVRITIPLGEKRK